MFLVSFGLFKEEHASQKSYQDLQSTQINGLHKSVLPRFRQSEMHSRAVSGKCVDRLSCVYCVVLLVGTVVSLAEL